MTARMRAELEALVARTICCMEYHGRLLPQELGRPCDCVAWKDHVGSARAVLAALDAAGALAGEWRTIETAPKDGSSMLLWMDEHTEIGFWDIHQYHKGPSSYWRRVRSYSVNRDRANQPTHWHPLPTTPSEPRDD